MARKELLGPYNASPVPTVKVSIGLGVFNLKLVFMKKALLPLMLLIGLVGCKNKSETDENTITSPQAEQPTVNVPDFSADSAFAWVKAQVDFGPRNPGSKGHALTADFLVAELKRFTPEVLVQTAPIRMHDGKTFPLKNIIASFNPEAKKRILLSAHWDTRPRADQDSERSNEPIAGANDGASGVAVLLEIARQLAAQPVKVGVDIVLFDLEDYGISEASDSYCMGSQYWAAKPHKAGYKADYGILLDMVGAKDARFFQEGFSTYYAAHVVRKVWNTAYDLGYGRFFAFQSSAPITDDHYYVNKIAGIPMIDIIQYDPLTNSGFGAYWHTHADDLAVIDPVTLKAVGQTLLHLLYHE